MLSGAQKDQRVVQQPAPALSLLLCRAGPDRGHWLGQAELRARQDARQHAGLGPSGGARGAHVQGADPVQQVQQRRAIARGRGMRRIHDPRADGDLGDRHRAMEDRPAWTRA